MTEQRRYFCNMIQIFWIHFMFFFDSYFDKSFLRIFFLYVTRRKYMLKYNLGLWYVLKTFGIQVCGMVFVFLEAQYLILQQLENPYQSL